MSDLREIYNEMVMDHNKSPRNHRKLEDANHAARGYNQLCGDLFEVYARVENGVIVEVAFQSLKDARNRGDAGLAAKDDCCAISMASASMMTQALKGKTVEEADALFDRFRAMVTSPIDVEPDVEGLGKLQSLSGVRKLAVRIKCATLPWHTLHAALHDVKETSTE